jgi:Ricin-type beta-trefoil lectin domain
MKQAYFLATLMVFPGPVANAIEFNKEALKSMQAEGHKIVQEAAGGRAYQTSSGECLDIAGSGLVVRKCNAKAKSQMWSLDGQGHLVASDGRCVAGAQLQNCGEDKAGIWKLDGQQRLVNGAKQCLHVQANPPTPGAKVVAAPCSKAPNQVWK